MVGPIFSMRGRLPDGSKFGSFVASLRPVSAARSEGVPWGAYRSDEGGEEDACLKIGERSRNGYDAKYIVIVDRSSFYGCHICLKKSVILCLKDCIISEPEAIFPTALQAPG